MGSLGPAEVRNMTVAEYVVQCLVDCGVRHVFGGHGAAIAPIIDALNARKDIQYIYTRCEVNASLTAAAYAKLTNGLGCCIGTSGPGSSHLTTGLLDAALDRVSVLCITGLKKVHSLGYSDFQDIRQTEIFRTAGVDFSTTVMHKQQVIPIVRDAVAAALGNFTCAHIAIPVNIQREVICPPPILCSHTAGHRVQPTVSHIHYLINAARIIKACKDGGRQLLLAVGQRARDAGEEILALAEALDAPVVTTQDAKGFVRESHPLVLGVAGIFGNPGMMTAAKFIEMTDLVVAFGWDDHSQLMVGSDGLQERMMIEFDTAANLVETRFQAMETVIGNIAFCCQHLTQLLAHEIIPLDPDALQKCAPNLQPVLRSWMTYGAQQGLPKLDIRHRPKAVLEKAKEKLTMDLTLTPSGYVAPSEEIHPNYCHPGRLLSQLSAKLHEGAVVCVDVGDVTIWTSLCVCLDKPGQRMLASMRLGTMGYSTCAALAATACCPDNQVIMIAGDGGIQMSVNELATLVQLGAKHLLIIVLVNGSLGRVVNEPTPGPGGHPTGCGIINPNFVKLAEAYGGCGVRINSSDPNDIDKVLDQGLSYEGLFVIEVMQEPTLAPCMAKYQPPPPEKRTELRSHLFDRRASGQEMMASLLPHIGPSPVEVHQGIAYRPHKDPNYSVTFHGHVDFVLKGIVPQPILDHPIPASSMKYAFEAGTTLPDNLNSIGEMLAVKGRAYVKCTDKSCADYYKTISGNSVMSPAAGIVTPLDATPLMEVELEEGRPEDRRFSDILVSMLHTLQDHPFCTGGWVLFRRLSATAMTKATVYKEELLQHTQEYYQPEVAQMDLADRAGYVFGFVANFQKRFNGVAYENIRRVLYPGSGGKPGMQQPTSISYHFHIGILRSEYTNVGYDDLEPSMFEEIEHLDCASTVRAMHLELFPIKDIHPHVPGISDALPPFSTLMPDGSWNTRALKPLAREHSGVVDSPELNLSEPVKAADQPAIAPMLD